MQLYFVKATYTNNVYKLSNFFLNNEYKLVATKMLDINFRPDDGVSSFITKNTVLPDGTSIRDHTHIIVPGFDKIYRISAIDYMNNDQYMIIVDEDPFIGQYLALESKNIILNRTNDHDNFRGVNDISDLTLKETITTKSITGDIKSGKWALLFFQYNPDDPVIGLKFDNTVYGQHLYAATLAALILAYPEVTTDEPELVDYFQKIAYVVDTTIIYQCVWYNGAMTWVLYNSVSSETIYFDTASVVQPAKINKTDVMTICIALPFETDLWSSDVFNLNLVSYDQFLGPVDVSLIDIKIVNDLVLRQESISEVYDSGTRELKKRIIFEGQSYLESPTYSDAALANVNTQRILSFHSFNYDIDVSASFETTTNDPKKAEPFYKYDLYVYGKKYTIPYYLMNDIHLLIAINSGVVNYLIYFNDKRNILASGSFTHSIKYQIDQLDAFYSQNPTYKDQFFTKMATDSIKTVAAGAIGGSVVPGLGSLAGGVAGVGAAGVDAGLSLINLNFQEKSLRIKPDQIFGENSEVSLQVLNVFGIYWVKSESDNIDLMITEYDLRGFPTSKVTTIAGLSYDLTTVFAVEGTSKVIYGEIKSVIKNEYTTAFINQKLKQGVIIVR